MSPLPSRFEVHGVLGRGSFGDVYLATDLERRARVAVKRLRAPSPKHVRRFKQEFRALSRLHHQNLVTLYELCVADDEWLLTMEPVPGSPPRSPSDFTQALPGIADGLNGLHEAGYLHHDLKPENVTWNGSRAVLLDFGLLGRSGVAEPLAGNLMAIPPEQAAGGEVGPPGDWYALGVMLHVALTGSPPFTGRGAQVLAKKMRLDPPVIEPDCAADPALARLANALLNRNPDERMRQAAEPLRQLGASAPHSGQQAYFIGRRGERATLEEAWVRAETGTTSHVHVSGDPGMGKSALLENWARRHPEAVWLHCFERDGSAYAGLDSVVERLLGFGREAPLTEEHGTAMAQLFPALKERWPTACPRDAAGTRRLAADALNILLREHASPHTPILIVEDAQWGGSDTGLLLRMLLLRPPWLLITASREDARTGPLMSRLDPPPWPVTCIELGRLDSAELDELEPTVETRRTRQALNEAQGHPLLLNRLLRSEDGPHDLSPLLRAEARELPSGAAALMQVLVAAARPVDRTLALAALNELSFENEKASPLQATTVLLRRRLARMRHPRAGGVLEPAHALIRQACEAEFPDTEASHAALDDAMQALGIDEPEHQARHARSARRLKRASALYEKAGERASSRLAFTRAAELFGSAWESGATDAKRPELLAAQAGAEGAAGLHMRAASTFAKALERRTLDLDDEQGMSWARQRAEHLLHACEMGEGERALDACLEAAGLAARRGRRALVVSIMAHRVWLRMIGQKDPTPRLTPGCGRERARIDLAYSAAIALTNTDGLRGTEFALRSLRRAHALGDVPRFARSFVLVAAYSAAAGARERHHVARMVERAKRFGQTLQDPYLQGMAEAGDCLRLFHLGEHRESLAAASRAERIFRARARAPREATTALVYRCANLASLGRYEQMATARLELLEDSITRRDGFGETHARVGLMNLVWLVADDVDGARQDLELGMKRWAGVHYQIAHFFGLLAACRVDLYEQRPQRCVERIDEAMPSLVSSFLLRMPYIRAHLSDLKARAWLQHLASGVAESQTAQARAVARLEARRIRRLETPVYDPLADVIDGGVLASEGNREGAAARLRRAQDAFRELGLAGHAFAVSVALQHPPALPREDMPKDLRRFAAALGLASIG